MLAILALMFTLWCAYEWGKTDSRKKSELEELREKVRRYENRGNPRL
jgi:hypothetical protein